MRVDVSNHRSPLPGVARASFACRFASTHSDEASAQNMVTRHQSDASNFVNADEGSSIAKHRLSHRAPPALSAHRHAPLEELQRDLHSVATVIYRYASTKALRHKTHFDTYLTLLRCAMYFVASTGFGKKQNAPRRISGVWSWRRRHNSLVRSCCERFGKNCE